jgi:hypothetical protein
VFGVSGQLRQIAGFDAIAETVSQQGLISALFSAHGTCIFSASGWRFAV